MSNNNWISIIWGFALMQKLYIIQGQVEGTPYSDGAKLLCSVYVFIATACSTIEMLKDVNSK